MGFNICFRELDSMHDGPRVRDFLLQQPLSYPPYDSLVERTIQL